MPSDSLPEARDSYLASHSLPGLRFDPARVSGGPLHAVWDALSKRFFDRAAERALAGISACGSSPVEERAALYAALGAAAHGSGNRKRALAAAEESVLLLPQQWLAHRVITQVYWTSGDFENGYFYLSTLLEPETTTGWDEPMSAEERHVSIAAMAWRLQDWDGVFEHLTRAYPAGPASMPVPLREDAFRVAVYRDQSPDAASAAEALIADYSVEDVDRMLRTIDARGWSDEALDLYRKAYNRHRSSELLRRRLVGLCVRQGCVDEARALTEGNALDLAA